MRRLAVVIALAATCVPVSLGVYLASLSGRRTALELMLDGPVSRSDMAALVRASLPSCGALPAPSMAPARVQVGSP